MLIKILIAFFLCLIIYQFFAACVSTIEGMENNSSSVNSDGYQTYNKDDPNNALILAQQNAGNIDVLRNQMNDLTTIKSEFDDVKLRMDKLDGQVTDLVNQQAQYAQDVAGSEPVAVSGTQDEEDEEEAT
jgi:hypothetical protein